MICYQSIIQYYICQNRIENEIFFNLSNLHMTTSSRWIEIYTLASNCSRAFNEQNLFQNGFDNEIYFKYLGLTCTHVLHAGKKHTLWPQTVLDRAF